MNMGFEEFKSEYPLLYDWDCKVLKKCNLLVYASDWVREQTIVHYGVPPRKIRVIPFGANIEPISPKAAEGFINHRSQTPCQLTFLGIDWKRKGLPLVYEVLKNLNENGIKAKLNVIGCTVETVGLKRRIKHYTRYRPFSELDSFKIKFHGDKNVNQLGFLSKNNPSHYRQLAKILKQSHFLLHPAVFECFGIALVEANAFGVPVIATHNHGPKTIIKNGTNGYLFERKEFVEQSSNIIK